MLLLPFKCLASCLHVNALCVIRVPRFRAFHISMRVALRYLRPSAHSYKRLMKLLVTDKDGDVCCKQTYKYMLKNKHGLSEGSLIISWEYKGW